MGKDINSIDNSNPPKRKAREGWAEMLEEADKRGELELTEEDKEWLNAPLNSFDHEDWEWE